MADTGNAENDGNAASEQSQGIPPQQEGTAAPSEREIAERNNQRAINNREQFLYRPVRNFINCLNRHDGVITAAATVAIASLTYSLSVDSSRQADTANEQFRIMRSQLEEMRIEKRAWVGVIGASMVGEKNENPVPIATGLPFVVTTYYRNSGHEPATKVHLLDVLAEIYTAEQYDNGFAEKDIGNKQVRCTSKPGRKIGGIEFPSDQPNLTIHTYFTSQPKAGQSLGTITDEVVRGDSKIVFLYCITYESGGIPHHTAFGYFYQGHHAHPNSLAIVEIANDAD